MTPLKEALLENGGPLRGQESEELIQASARRLSRRRAETGPPHASREVARGQWKCRLVVWAALSRWPQPQSGKTVILRTSLRVLCWTRINNPLVQPRRWTFLSGDRGAALAKPGSLPPPASPRGCHTPQNQHGQEEAHRKERGWQEAPVPQQSLSQVLTAPKAPPGGHRECGTGQAPNHCRANKDASPRPQVCSLHRNKTLIFFQLQLTFTFDFYLKKRTIF